MKSLQRPNFFIAGAPKCGTTALAQYLDEHPAVFICKPKEPNYFARHLRTPSAPRESYHESLEGYLSLFSSVDRSIHIAVGDASTTYLRSPKALMEIRAQIPAAKVIVMLRNPADLAYSWHGQKILENQETELDFRKAWELETRRRQGDELPENLRLEDALFYSQVAALGTQVERLIEIFPREQVLLLFTDDLRADPRTVYESAIRFLCVDPEPRETFELVRPGKEVRDLRLWRLINERPGALGPIAHVAKRVFGEHATSGMNRIRSALTRPRPALDREMRRRLATHFDSEISIIESISGRSLDDWRSA